MMIHAVIFDWDEVIAKTDQFNEYAFGKVLSSRGLPFDHELYRQHFLGRTLHESLRGYLLGTAQPVELIEELSAGKRATDTEFEQRVTPHEDALHLIARLRGTYPLAIASGTRKVLCEAGLRKFNLADAFDAVVTSEDYVNGKPAPDALLAALAAICKTRGVLIETAETLVIEDAPNGVRAAKRAGMICAAVTHTHSADELNEADIVLDDLRELDTEKFRA